MKALNRPLSDGPLYVVRTKQDPRYETGSNLNTTSRFVRLLGHKPPERRALLGGQQTAARNWRAPQSLYVSYISSNHSTRAPAPTQTRAQGPSRAGEEKGREGSRMEDRLLEACEGASMGMPSSVRSRRPSGRPKIDRRRLQMKRPTRTRRWRVQVQVHVVRGGEATSPSSCRILMLLFDSFPFLLWCSDVSWQNYKRV